MFPVDSYSGILNLWSRPSCVFQALRQLGSTQMLDGAEDEAETSLLRAVRLGSTAASQVKVINSPPVLT